MFANWFNIWSSGDVTWIAWFQSWPPGCVTCIATLPWNVSVLHQNKGGIGMDFPIRPEFWWSTDILWSSIFLQGVDQKMLPCGQGRIDSVKINPSLLMMRECPIVLVYSSARVTSVMSAKGGSLSQFVSETRTHRSDPRDRDRDTWVRNEHYHRKRQ